ncbi:unnamed protein product [Heterobilharzia americana]|nr:unnamed protein product [Heterobilharzia americana]
MASSSKGNSMKCIKPNKPKKIKDVKSKRPPGPYALFVQSRKSLYRGKISEFAKTCASEWRKLSQVERDKFKAKSVKLGRHIQKSPSNYIKFVNSTYDCLRRKHQDWTSREIHEQLMKNYKKIKCSCNKKKERRK